MADAPRNTPHAFILQARGGAAGTAGHRRRAQGSHVSAEPRRPDLKIVAYAGVPLTLSGAALGAFCVIDNEPHAWSYDEVQLLRELAACVMHEIDLRGRLRDADARLKQLEGSGNHQAPLM